MSLEKIASSSSSGAAPPALKGVGFRAFFQTFISLIRILIPSRICPRSGQTARIASLRSVFTPMSAKSEAPIITYGRSQIALHIAAENLLKPFQPGFYESTLFEQRQQIINIAAFDRSSLALLKAAFQAGQLLPGQHRFQRKMRGFSESCIIFSSLATIIRNQPNDVMTIDNRWIFHHFENNRIERGGI